MRALVKSFWKDESGQAVVEYGLVIALVAVAIIGTIVAFRDKITTLFNNMGNSIAGAK
jgi:pilus assembly protein Flp/PilA